jgi:hypothetical protein
VGRDGREVMNASRHTGGVGTATSQLSPAAVGRRGIDIPADELLDLVPGDAASATWTLDCKATPSSSGVDLTGPYIQGRPGGRFIYFSWGTLDEPHDFKMFRRAKLQLDAVPPATLDNAVEHGLLVARLGLTDTKANPLCAAVQPPVIDCSAEPGIS